MKKSILVIALSLMGLTAFCQDGSPAVKFNETRHNFGTVKQNVPAKTKFIFTNTSSTPLIIESAAPSCGCTTPSYPKTPIMKGKSDTIVVAYNAEALGHFNKSVTVKFANAEKPIQLFIEGDVVKSK